jgi:hypothetical protein
MILKKGSKGEQVKLVQGFLGLKQDGEFGPKTESAVRKWQSDNGLVADGIVGPATWDLMGIASTDASEMEIGEGIQIKDWFLPEGEYKKGPVEKEYLFLHHTAGWNNPYNTINNWSRDNRGSVATEFVIGGQSVKGNDFKYDGEIVRCIPNEGYGWHLGKNGSQHMHVHSVGIEVCNFGNLTKGGYYKRTNEGKVWVDKNEDKCYTWAGVEVHDSQVVKLDEPFRGYDLWHRYSEKQIESLKELIIYISKRDKIDICKGLIEEITKNGRDAFEFNEDAYYGRVKGMWSHTNTRKDKFDMFPQPELIEMLLSL